MTDQAVDGGDRHAWVGEHGVPGAWRLVGGNQDRAPLVSCAGEFKQDGGLGLVLLDVGDVVEDEQVVFVEFFNGACEFQLLTCGWEVPVGSSLHPFGDLVPTGWPGS